MKISINILTACIVILVACESVYAQSTDEILDQLTYDLNDEDQSELTVQESILDDLIKVNTTHHFLYSGLSLSSSAPYAGREYYAGLGSTLPQVFYINTKGWMFGLGIVKYESPFPVSTSFVMSGGYSFYMDKKKKTRMRFGYSRGTSFDNTEKHEISSSNTFSTSITFIKPKFISSRIGYSYMVSQYNSHQFAASFYKKIRLKKWSNGNSLEITPDLNFYFSDHEYLADISIASETDTEIFYNYQYAETFGLLNTALSIPLEINLGDFDLTLEYTHNMPRRFSSYEDFHVSRSFSFSIGYFLFIQ
ncbi:hypothetical protein E9993_22280 [Labilibacter sediminis]|nr:hypothetical protein E9993_22280 [Labilibacter sediminis]